METEEEVPPVDDEEVVAPPSQGFNPAEVTFPTKDESSSSDSDDE